MKAKLFKSALFAAMFAPFALVAQAPRILHGTVVTAADNLPLAAAVVKETATGNVALTDENGFFELLLEGENPRIEVGFLGLEPLEMAVGAAHNLTVELAPVPVAAKRRDKKNYTFSY